MSEVPIVGVPQPLFYIVENPDGSQTRFPYVMLHLFSDMAIAALGNLIQQIVRDELDARGLTRILTTATDGKAQT
jgi:hypothetical protein